MPGFGVCRELFFDIVLRTEMVEFAKIRYWYCSTDRDARVLKKCEVLFREKMKRCNFLDTEENLLHSVIFIGIILLRKEQ